MFDIFYFNNKLNLPAIKVNSENEARKLSRTRYLWIVDGANDYSNFDFSWEPVPWEEQKHVFASQHQENGGTCLIPKSGYKDTNYRQETIQRTKTNEPFIFLDFGNSDSNKTYEQINKVSNNVYKTRFISSYHGTLTRVIDKIDAEYVWVTASVCDYSIFDFTWHPSEWHKEMFHVFPSNEQKFGDTFYIHVPTFKEQVNNIELLEWYETIHFVKELSSLITRWPVPRIEVDDNSIVDDIKQHEFKEPVVLFTNNIFEELSVPTINLWREKTRSVIPLSDGTNTTLVPRDAKNHIIAQVYDYPYISKKYITEADNPLDIVYISNGEEHADINWEHLQKITKDIPNRLVRVDRVKGRAEAYKEAAKQSNTAWFFSVFAKLQVNPEFNWKWQPDRLQQNKHYIFHARNPLVDVEYGHAAIIAYHKNLVLSNPSYGLDFTLDQPHEVVPLLSGTTYYENDNNTAWRTSFREAIKLYGDVLKTGNIESEYRLSKWCSSNGTEVGDWSMRGGLDGVEYYKEVSGNHDDLRLSYEWEWLSERFDKKYK